MKKVVIQFGFFLVAGCASMGLFAQPYPSKPVSMVVPQAAGGTNDIVARLIAPAFGEALRRIRGSGEQAGGWRKYWHSRCGTLSEGWIHFASDDQ